MNKPTLAGTKEDFGELFLFLAVKIALELLLNLLMMKVQYYNPDLFDLLLFENLHQKWNEVGELKLTLLNHRLHLDMKVCGHAKVLFLVFANGESLVAALRKRRVL